MNDSITCWHGWAQRVYRLLAVAIAIVVAGCVTSSPVTSGIRSHFTATTEADVWKTLEQRSLHIPILAAGQPCPTTHEHLHAYFGLASGSEPAYPSLTEIPFASAQTFAHGNPHNNGWGGQKVLWLIQSPYQGPILIRGHQVDGPNVLRFNGGLDQASYNGDWDAAPLLTELHLMGSAQYDSPNGGWPSYTRARAPGCYIYQVDGLSFSGYVIFQAVFGH